MKREEMTIKFERNEMKFMLFLNVNKRRLAEHLALPALAHARRRIFKNPNFSSADFVPLLRETSKSLRGGLFTFDK